MKIKIENKRLTNSKKFINHNIIANNKLQDLFQKKIENKIFNCKKKCYKKNAQIVNIPNKVSNNF